MRAGFETEPLRNLAAIERLTVKPDQIRPDDLYVGLENMRSDGGFDGVREVEPGALKSNKFRFDDGHILFGKLRPYLCKIAMPTFSGVCSTDILPIRPGPRLHASFLMHFLRTPEMVSHAASLSTGINLPRLSPKALEEMPIPVPPIEEQRRIAVALDAANALRAKRRQALAKLDTLAQAIFVDMFGDPVSNPKGWLQATVSDSLNFLKYGPRFYDESYSELGVPIVRITDLDSFGNLDFASMPKYEVSDSERLRHRLMPGDIIFARSGATVGKVALMREDDPECIAGAYFVHMRFSEAIEPTYAFAALRSASIQTIVAKKSRQAAQQNFSGPGIKELPLPVPPISTQRQFAARVATIRRLRNQLERGRESLDALFGSLQQRAFRGDL